MSSRAYDIMRELPAIFANVSGIDEANVVIGWRDPSNIEEGKLPWVMIYNPETDEPDPPSFGLRAISYGFTVVLVNGIDAEEATLQMCEEMAAQLTVAFTNADIVYMSPGSVATAEQTSRSIVGALLFAEYEGV